MSTHAPNPGRATTVQAINAQAAVWLSRLNADDRTAAVDAACQEWLNADPRHRAAFDVANRMWEDASTLPVSLAARINSRGRSRRPNRRIASFLVASAAAAAVAGVTIYLTWPQELRTRTGQQMTLPLADGSRVTLNTDTRVQIRFGAKARRIELKSGEALFEVAQDRTRPFIVRAGDREITALSTQFVVRYDARQTAVTLVEGKVRVDSLNAAAPGMPATVLRTGQRMTIENRHAALVDRPAIEAVTGWRRGEITFDRTPLSMAIEEMNRYSARKLKLARGVDEQMPVSGLFRSGDAENFALALADSYPLQAVELAGEIEIQPAASH